MQVVARHKEPPPREFLFCADLGFASDYTALSILNRLGSTPAVYAVQYLRRLPLQTPYQQVAEVIDALIRREPLASSSVHLVVDATGVGRPVVEMLQDKDLDPISIYITAGYDSTQVSSGEWRVPKRQLVTAMQMVIQSDRMQVSDQLEHAQKFLAEAREFQLKQRDSGALTFGASTEQVHDDLVLSVAMGLWFGESILGENPPSRTKPKRHQVRGIGIPATMRRRVEEV